MREKEINFQPPIAIRGLSIKRIFNQAQYFRIVNYDQVSTWKFEYPIFLCDMTETVTDYKEIILGLLKEMEELKAAYSRLNEEYSSLRRRYQYVPTFPYKPSG